MMNYVFEAMDKQGNLVHRDVSAHSSDEAIEKIKFSGYQPLKLIERPSVKVVDGIYVGESQHGHKVFYTALIFVGIILGVVGTLTAIVLLSH